jgi:hypothetical protein
VVAAREPKLTIESTGGQSNAACGGERSSVGGAEGGDGAERRCRSRLCVGETKLIVESIQATIARIDETDDMRCHGGKW